MNIRNSNERYKSKPETYITRVSLCIAELYAFPAFLKDFMSKTCCSKWCCPPPKKWPKMKKLENGRNWEKIDQLNWNFLHFGEKFIHKTPPLIHKFFDTAWEATTSAINEQSLLHHKSVCERSATLENEI